MLLENLARDMIIQAYEWSKTGSKNEVYTLVEEMEVPTPYYEGWPEEVLQEFPELFARHEFLLQSAHDWLATIEYDESDSGSRYGASQLLIKQYALYLLQNYTVEELDKIIAFYLDEKVEE